MRLVIFWLIPVALLLSGCETSPPSKPAPLGDYATLEQLADAFRKVSANYPVQPRSMPPEGRRQFVRQVFATAGYDYTSTLESVARQDVDVGNQEQQDLLELLFLPHQGIAKSAWEDFYSARELEAVQAIMAKMP